MLAQYFMDIDERGVILEVIVHMGTLTSILIYYRDDLLYLIKCAFNGMDEARTYLFHLGVSTVPCVLVALLFDKFIESAFLPSVVIPMLLITGLVLFSTYFSLNRPIREFTIFIAFCIGIAQACALMPGISRSGFTISVALFMGIRSQDAAKFAFFMAIPVLFGAGILQMNKIVNLQQISMFPLFMGFFSSAITGYLVIDWILDVISKHKFYLFSIYCFTIAIIGYILID